MTAGADGSNRWADLRPRMVSAVVMLAIGSVAIWMGGIAFAALAAIMCALMIWELARITALHPSAIALSVAMMSGVCILAALPLGGHPVQAALLLPAAALALTPRSNRLVAVIYALAIMVAGFGLVELRGIAGIGSIIWLVLVVVASDVMGYFAGRTLGGPKFWPAVSPKKTWSGTVAGWLGAALVGAGFALAGQGGWALVILSPLVAFAGQLGDIAESWIKRRAGVKDSSHLIPGHGGALDRFDSLIGAGIAVLVIGLLMPFPIGG
jgi:phosphatidate cytidylyltransferase